jgi:hypothetical protein
VRNVPTETALHVAETKLANANNAKFPTCYTTKAAEKSALKDGLLSEESAPNVPTTAENVLPSPTARNAQENTSYKERCASKNAILDSTPTMPISAKNA